MNLANAGWLSNDFAPMPAYRAFGAKMAQHSLLFYTDFSLPRKKASGPHRQTDAGGRI
ncbi:hypothetical protein HMP0721_1313 [Pseudoramibacter alactolyticus ATCC 23263]|uniref:Uncharacterized protein n=1 Tax=Pseudoramibacter alactolyticus ATCC 23263 TaxID=887929 RepID=E6MH29_9FIRM|nr:hypothetical protein HMP0721_1313 [Pseudoramibacter alactolyticus ATCC 23263]